MASIYFHNKEAVIHTISQLHGACEMILTWNKNVNSTNDYLCSPDGMQKMAASCMLIESIGEGIKKIDKLAPQFLQQAKPEIPWKAVKGLRDHIAHGYFNLDADIIFDVVINEIPKLQKVFSELHSVLITPSSK